jgi:RHS repeat-associated protein
MGRLFEISSGSSKTQFLYDGDRLVAEYNGSGALLRRYVHGAGADEPLLWYEGSGLTTRRGLLTNHQGSIIAVADAAGASVGINAYDAYGVPEGFPNSTNLGRFQYTGQVWLAEVGLYYYKARMYSPSLGRFMQTDPIGYDDEFNLYSYVDGDPVNSVDPTGLRDVDVYIWQAEGGSVGHVMVTEHNSFHVILSQFPANGKMWGPNLKKDYQDTFRSEGRSPSSVWRVNVPDDKAFDRAASRELTLKRWSWSPSRNSTQCSIAASRALKAGGVNLSSITTGILMPGFFENNLEKNAGQAGNDTEKLLNSAAAYKGYDSIKVNSNDTVTGTFTETGSRIPRAVTCDAQGRCTSG